MCESIDFNRFSPSFTKRIHVARLVGFFYILPYWFPFLFLLYSSSSFWFRLLFPLFCFFLFTNPRPVGIVKDPSTTVYVASLYAILFLFVWFVCVFFHVIGFIRVDSESCRWLVCRFCHFIDKKETNQQEKKRRNCCVLQQRSIIRSTR